MAIYERGYRSYAGGFQSTPGWWVIAREGWSQAWRHKGVRWMGTFVLLLACVGLVQMFMEMGATELTGRLRGGDDKLDFGERSIKALNRAHFTFYTSSSWLAVLAGVLMGCGLIADDLRSHGLTLYLVRPISRPSYVLGKALTLPIVFVILCLLPGLAMWLIVGLWQPPGETLSFLHEHREVAWRAVRHCVVVTASTTGLMLLLSSVTAKRGAALAAGAAISLLGGVLALAGRLLPGLFGEVGGSLSILRNALREFRIASGRMMRWLPTERGVWIVTISLLVVGLLAVAWRARTTEVAE